MGLWGRMPETMIKKVAEAAALRMAFPADLSGVYADEEMPQEAERLPAAEPVIVSAPVSAPPLVPLTGSPSGTTPTAETFNYNRFWAWVELNQLTPTIVTKTLGVTLREWVKAGGTEEQAKALLLKVLDNKGIS